MGELRFDGKVALVTGAGNGLGRTHALLLASRGAKVLVNDLGGGMHGGEGKSSSAADKVVEEIKAAGGTAAANYDSVEDGDKIVKAAIDAFGRIDVVVNNAGILRDTTFHKMTLQDWELIYRVHVLGGFRVTHAAWPLMREQGYGRIIFTASAAGIYGNFGQANYAMAKLGLVGLANTLALEGAKKNVFVNVIAPIAGSRLTETVMPKQITDALKPEYVSPLVAWLAHDSCTENGGLFEVGGGYIGKLRWERTVGKTFKLGRAFTPEQVEAAWPAVTDFGKATHPANITEALGPVMQNASSTSRGGNEFIDVDEALAAPPIETQSSYTERDLALYALGVGAAQNPNDPSDLKYVYENHGDGFIALPTFGVVPAINAVLTLAMEGRQAPGLHYGLDRILHGEQYTEVKRPLPTKATMAHKVKIKDIFDKGKNAVIVSEIRSYDAATGEELVTNELSMLIKGAGGWGGERGPSNEILPPDRKPDAVVEEKISPSQALLYRLSGDWNPLHVDPDFAKGFGFDRPILHGLCTFGYVGRAVIKSFANNDARLFKSIRVRFADSVFPGETLRTEMWKEKDRIILRALVVERNKVVISNAAVELYAEVPKPASKPVAAVTAAAPVATASTAAGAPTSGDIFGVIRAYVAENPELVKKVATVYQFKLTTPDSAWVLDLKSGAVTPGEAKADCTLTLTDSDFIAMCTGKADANKLFFDKKLKIGGNVIASQKLEFLRKIDPTKLKGVAGGAPAAVAATAPAAAATASSSGMSAEIFGVIGGYIAEHPELTKKVNTIYQFKLTAPDSAWVVDLKAGTVAAGETKADCTLTLTDADFVAMCTGKADANKLFFDKRLKIGGNVIASQKLEFLKQIDPTKVKPKSVAAPTGGGAAAPSGAVARAPAVFKALSERVSKTPALAKELNALIHVAVKDPAGAWTLDFASATPTVREGASGTPKCTLRLTDETLTALAKGERSVQDLFMHGELRVDGDLQLAHHLGFLKQLI